MTGEQQAASHGHCYCRGVQFTISNDAKPVFAGYCHCQDCRAANAATLYQYAYVGGDAFEISEGKDLLSWYTRDQSIQDRFRRYFCGRCGTRVYNYVAVISNETQQALYGVFPSLFDDPALAKGPRWAPQEHIFCEQSLLDLDQLNDGLVRHERLPADGFGLDEIPQN